MVGHKDTGEFSPWISPPYLCAYVILNKRDTIGGAAFSQIYWVQLQLIDRLEINLLK